jgi:agmatinase
MIGILPPEEGFLYPPGDFAQLPTAGVVVIPVPMESTSTYGQNSCLGPEAILEASRQVEFFDAALGCEPFRACGGIATTMPLDVENVDGQELTQQLCDAVTHFLKQKKFVVVIGGEHTSVLGSVKAHCAYFPDVTVLQLDAHSDLRDSFEGSPWNHACAMARVLDFHDSLVQVGIRSQDISERCCADEHAIPNFYAHDIHNWEEERVDWIAKVVSATRPRVYITLDCDVMDPSVIPATGTPEPGGLTWRQMDRLISRLCREREVVGLDISELAPIEGMAASQFTIAKLIYRFLGYRFAP